MVAFIVSSSLRSLLLVCYSLTPFWFRSEVLQSALQSFHKGNELAQEGKYTKAARQFQRGIFLGRPVVLQLQDQQQQFGSSAHSSIQDNPHLALEWLIQTYVASSQANMQLGDLEAARRDAWGACLLSHNNQAALQCMIEVCQLQKDKIGELSSLKMFLSSVYLQQQEYVESSSYSLMDDASEDDDMYALETEWDLLQLKTRTAQLQEELDKKYTKQRNDTHVVGI